MPPRTFPPAASDSSILALFLTSTTQLKAHRVLSLLHIQRSKIRSIASSLRRLAQDGALVELVSSSAAFPHPIYMLAPRAQLDDAAPQHASTIARSACSDHLLAAGPPQTPSPAIEAAIEAQREGADGADQVATAQAPLCAVCRECWPTEVLLPCRHQPCCKACWQKCVDRERSVHRKQERLKHELGPRGVLRSSFLPRCPVCMVAVEDVISPYISS